MDCLVQVAVDHAAFDYDKLYTYTVPEEQVPFARIGAIVLVPFGKGQKARTGIILSTDAQKPKSGLKELLEIERNSEPALSEELVRVLYYLKEQTFCTYSEAVRTILPKNRRMVLGENGLKPESETHLETGYRISAIADTSKLSATQTAIAELVRDKVLTYRDIQKQCGAARSTVNRLVEKGVLEKVKREKRLGIWGDAKSRKELFSLNEEQTAAFHKILDAANDPQKPNATLLYGVTSSGKTLVYISLIENMLEKGKGTILLVPEITLAAQMIHRLRNRFGDTVSILHSALTDAERCLEWIKIRQGKSRVVVGTRTAVFSPMQDIGMIIIDEEQESAYYSEQSPRFSAINIASFRARESGAHLLLASATPSLESYYKAQSGKINLVLLTQRYRNMPLPEVKIVDMAEERYLGNSSCISLYLKEEIDKRLERGEQTLLLLNRRGYRTLGYCSGCKKVLKCKNCDTALVYHKNAGRMVCHYCGWSVPYMEICSECGGAIRYTGVGTQKMEEEIGLLFPNASIARLDLDSVSRKNEVSRILGEFAEGKYDILIGTQMIAKGLDFASVTLVGVLNIDQMLLMPSYKAQERAFSMLTQVIGRSGRGERRGEAVIQTLDPGNPLLKIAAEQNYQQFYKREVLMRKLHLYPPFCAICVIGLLCENEKKAREAAEFYAAMLRQLHESNYVNEPIRILGPVPMRVSFMNNRYRWRLTVKYRESKAARAMLRESLEKFKSSKQGKEVGVYIDFNIADEV